MLAKESRNAHRRGGHIGVVALRSGEGRGGGKEGRRDGDMDEGKGAARHLADSSAHIGERRGKHAVWTERREDDGIVKRIDCPEIEHRSKVMNEPPKLRIGAP